MLLIGHRGCNYPGYNQNTIRSFEKVTAEGVKAIEFDVQLCADNELVVVHDLNLEKVSTGKGDVCDTESQTLKKLYAGDPDQGKDRIPFLSEVFDFFASCSEKTRPAIHLELKGSNTGEKAARLFMEYVDGGKLLLSDLLASSFNWDELKAFRKICPQARIALLEGAIRRKKLLNKTGPTAEHYYEPLFYYGNEDYMLLRFPDLTSNLELLKKICNDPQLQVIFASEMKTCLEGGYYTQELLETAIEMKASSVNLWFRTVSSGFVERAHQAGLKVYVYTANEPQDLHNLLAIGVDGIFTDFYTKSKHILRPYLKK